MECFIMGWYFEFFVVVYICWFGEKWICKMNFKFFYIKLFLNSCFILLNEGYIYFVNKIFLEIIDIYIYNKIFYVCLR